MKVRMIMWISWIVVKILSATKINSKVRSSFSIHVCVRFQYGFKRDSHDLSPGGVLGADGCIYCIPLRGKTEVLLASQNHVLCCSLILISAKICVKIIP